MKIIKIFAGLLATALLTALPLAIPLTIRYFTPQPAPPPIYPTSVPPSVFAIPDTEYAPLLATRAPAPTRTPPPTATAVPTPTPQPTATTVPTATPAPRYTPAPTFTPRPTSRPAPTLPLITGAATLNQEWQIPTARIFGVAAAHNSAAARDRQGLIIAGCYVIASQSGGTATAYTFSKDGRFSEYRVFVAVSGIAHALKAGECYEMLVQYESRESICYYTSRPLIYQPRACSGWRQTTRQFRLVDTSAIRWIPQDEWREDYWEYRHYQN